HAFDRAAAHRVGLQPQHAIEPRAVHPAALGEHVARAAGDLASDDDPAVAVAHLAVADDHVLHRRVHAPPIVVAAGLEGDAVVARVERAALDEHVAARLRVAAVVVRTVAPDADAADDDVRAQHRMDLPHRRVDDRHALDHDVAAAV